MDKVCELASTFKLQIIAQHYETNLADFNKHYDAYANWLEKIKPYPVLKINSQTGKDFFNFNQNKQLIELADAHQESVNKQVVHETHQG